MKRIDKVTKYLFRLGNSLSMIFFTFVMLISVANVLSRGILNFPILGTLDLVRMATLAGVALALAYNESVDGNVAVTIIPDTIKPRKANILNILTNIVAILFCLIVTYQLFLTGLTSLAKGDVTETLEMPIFIFHFILSAGFGINSIALIIKLITRIVNHMSLSNDKISLEKLADESAEKLVV